MNVRTGATPERLALAAQVRVLRDAGLTHRAVADKLSISRSYAADLDLDPDGAKGRARKDSYGGTCVDCGGRTTGSYGRSLAPERCASCSERKQHDERHWTAERVIDAIQRFARKEGRPPVALDWITSDPTNGYPAASSVYRRDKGSFTTWAEAVEAAGFPRPVAGYWQDEASRASKVESDPYAWLGALQRDILDELRRRGARRLRDLVHGSNPRCVRVALARLVRRGLVVEVGRGVYALAPAQERQAA